MEINKTQVYGLEASIRAMRNPMNSWDKSDSYVVNNNGICIKSFNNVEFFVLGDDDKNLSQILTKAGTEHCKHLRLINVWMDMELPRYIWQEFDTYKHVEKVSCSTMHKLTSRNLVPSDFESGIVDSDLTRLNALIDLYKITKDEQDFFLLKNLLPEGFLQKRTLSTNYQQLLNIYNQRKNHKMPQWKFVCNWILRLPYFRELTGLSLDETKENI